MVQIKPPLKGFKEYSGIAFLTFRLVLAKWLKVMEIYYFPG
jgi:hypothetical protein